MLVSKDVVLTYSNEKGMTLSMSFFSPFFLLECREQMQNNIASEKLAGCDGEMFTAQSCDARNIEITGYFDAVLGRRAMEGVLKRVFNTGCGGTLEYYHRKDRKRYNINCIVEKTPEVIFNNARVEFAISLKCLDPYWYGEEIVHTIPPHSLAFENIGDSAAGFSLELSGVSAVNPFITNGEREVAFVGDTQGKPLVFTSLPDKAAVTLSGANAMKYLSDSSRRSFFLLNMDENIISYGAASGAGNLSAKLTYKPRYLGTF